MKYLKICIFSRATDRNFLTVRAIFRIYGPGSIDVIPRSQKKPVLIFTWYKMKYLSLSVRLNLLKYSTDFNAVFRNRQSHSREGFICVIHGHYSRERRIIVSSSSSITHVAPLLGLGLLSGEGFSYSRSSLVRNDAVIKQKSLCKS